MSEIKIKSGALGNRAEMPKLVYDEKKGSELGYRTDEKALYIGTSNGNVRLCGAGDEARIKALESKPEYYSKTEVDEIIAGINARLGALEKPTEPSE